MRMLKLAACGVDCGECDSFPCGAYMEWVADLDHHKRALEYLLSLNKL